MISKPEAIGLMNSLGKGRVPFLFIIDFEMKATRLFPLDQLQSGEVMFDFQNKIKSNDKQGNVNNYTFLKFPVSFEEYCAAFEAVQKHIYSGNTFLLNLTFPTFVETDLTLREIFHKSIAKYKILVANEFVCFSPESFITITDGCISTYPMKGTMKALTSDSERELLSDAKEFAEHNTIVDLLRNDLSMVASSIVVKRFRYIERIQTHNGDLLQVSSEIRGKLPAGYRSRLGDIVFALLPAGSVTGAPKEKTTAIIREVEKTDRGYYTGVCGVFDGKNLTSAVLIRFIENLNGVLRFRSGGGITHLSNAQSEYEELKDKVYVPIA